MNKSWVFAIKKWAGKITILILLLATISCKNNKTNDPDISDSDTVILKVGNNKEFKTITAAASVATDDCIVEIDAGTYTGDVARWKQNNLIIRAVGGEVILDAAGKHIGGVGIWEINGGTISVEGITFKNAKVPDENGAGIRLSSGFVTIKNCRFLNNENGILVGNDGISTLTVQNSEFGYNGAGDGYSHNIYVGKIAKFSVSGSWFHHANIGHLIKTRAAVNLITYNLIADGSDAQSKASYEIDFASGGMAVVKGNIIQQSRTTENPIIISYSREDSWPWEDNELHVSHNTIVNNRTGTSLVISAPESIHIGAYNNLLSKNTFFDMDLMNIETGNVWFETEDLTADYAPKKSAYDSWIGKIDSDVDRHTTSKLKDMDISLVPSAVYKHPMMVKPLEKIPNIPGAVQDPAL